MTSYDIALTVNGEHINARVEARKSLVDFLRDDLILTGSHIGCEHGVCGACSVRVNGEVVRGCLMLAVQCDGASVETIEGVSDTGEIADLQDAWKGNNPDREVARIHNTGDARTDAYLDQKYDLENSWHRGTGKR